MPGQVRAEYNLKVMHNLEIQGMDSITGTIRKHQKRLRLRLIEEWSYVQLKPSVSLGQERQSKTMSVLLNTVPCILHAENRMGIKIAETLFIECLSNAMKFAKGSESAAAVEFLQRIERIINKEVFGDKENEAQWKCPVSDDKKQIATITMNNVQTRKLIGKLDSLIEVCVVDQVRRSKWIQCIHGDYKKMIGYMTQHRNLSMEELKNFQRHADAFYASWINLHGVAGVTNYIHMAGAGHFAEYIQHWGHLYQHSQQGWEAFNNVLKIFYYRRTQRGGRTGDGSKTRLLPIARWLQQRMVWMAGGISFEEMKDLVEQ